MTVSPISAPDAALLRRTGSAIRALTLNIWPLTVVGTAEVTADPDYTDIVMTLGIGSESAGWDNTKINQFVRIVKPDGRISFEGAIRRLGSPGELLIQPIRRGDTGTAQEYHATIRPEDIVTAYDVFVAKSFLTLPSTTPLVTPLNIRKRGDRLFSTSRPPTEFPQPQVNIGPHRFARVDPDTGVARLAFTVGVKDYRGDSATTGWVLPASGAALVAGYALTDATIEVDFEPGRYVMECEAERVGGSTSTDTGVARRYVWITDGEDELAFSDLFTVQVESVDSERDGTEISANVYARAGQEAALLDYFYPGAPVLLTIEPEYRAGGWAAGETPSDGPVTNFFGYLLSYERVSHDWQRQLVYSLKIVSPFTVYGQLPFAPQELAVKDPPENWQQIYSGIANLAYANHYVLEHHAPALLQLNDVILDDLEDFEFPSIGISASNVGGALKDITGHCSGANIGCAADGTLIARRHLSFETFEWRAAEPTRFTAQAADVEERLVYPRDTLKKASQVIGAAIVSNTDITTLVARTARTSLYAPAQGAGPKTVHSFIAEDLDDISHRAGHWDAYLNRPTEAVGWDWNGYMDIVDPARMEPFAADFGTDYDPLQTRMFTHGRLIPLRSLREFEYTERGVVCSVHSDFEPETNGAESPLEEIEEPVDELGAPMGGVAPAWSHSFDFTASNGGFFTFPFGSVPPNHNAVWSSGNGWTTANDGSPLADVYRIRRTWAAAAAITLVTVHVNPELTGTNPGMSIFFNAGAVRHDLLGPASSYTFNVTATGVTDIAIMPDRYIGGAQSQVGRYITGVDLSGPGSSPF